MPKYFKLDSRKVTYGEYLNIAGSWKVVFPWTLKLLGLQMPMGLAMPAIESMKDFEIPEGEFSAMARAKLQPLLEQCLTLGFHSPRFYSYEDLRRTTQISFIALLHESGTIMVRLMHTAAFQVQPPKEKMLVVMLTLLWDGTRFVTSNQKPQFLNSPGTVVNRLVGAEPMQMFPSHVQCLSEFKPGQEATVIESLEMMDEFSTDYEKRAQEFGMKRGIYVWMTPEEVAAQQGVKAAVQAQSVGGSEYEQVLWEIHLLQNKKANWSHMFIMLIVSLFLFVTIGSRQWSWSYVLMVVPILFIHELGHYLAMRAFNYRNLRMFFIPFFGAAVTGQNHNLPGWKKVVVYLMGPMPGIVLGAILGGIGLLLHQALLIKFAMLMLILNGFNLLPVLPFDGGWIFHILLFSRNLILGAVFRIVAAFALMLLGHFLRTRILFFLGMLMLFSVPLAFRSAKIASTLRTRSIPPVPDDEQSIPPETAKLIIDEVEKSGSNTRTNKMVAQETLRVFEILNTRPPGWLATLALLCVHICCAAIAMAMAMVFVLVLLVGRNSSLANFMNQVAELPKHKLACGPLPEWLGNFVMDPNGYDICLIANFSNNVLATASFQSLTNHLPSASSLKQFGDTLFLSLPAGQDQLRKEWVRELEIDTKDVFLETPHAMAVVSIAAMVPNSAQGTNLFNQLNEYLTLDANLALIPPWYPADGITPAEQAQRRLARATFQKLRLAWESSAGDDQINALAEQAAKAFREGDKATAENLREQIKQLRVTWEKQGAEKIRQGGEGPVDAQLADWYLSDSLTGNPTNTPAADPLLEKMAMRMGQLPLFNGQILPADARYCARSGEASVRGLILRIDFISFTRLETGAPRLAEWLCDQGCTHLRYEIYDMDPTGDGADAN